MVFNAIEKEDVDSCWKSEEMVFQLISKNGLKEDILKKNRVY